MEVQLLIGLMGVLCVVAVYFWVIRPRRAKEPETK
jgi:hypothetical protein